MIAPPATAPGADIRDAVGLEQAVTFHLDAGVLDEPLDTNHLSEALAVQRAVETSPELQAALARVRMAEKDADIAGRLPNPILSLVLRQPSDSGMTQVEAALTDNLLAIVQRTERASMAGYRLRAESSATLSAALDVVADVQRAYAQCQVIEERVRVLERRLSAFDRLVEAARQQQPGTGQGEEPLSLSAEHTELSLDLDRWERDLRIARLALASRIGQPSGAADWTLDAWSPPAAAPVDEDACLERALACRPEIVALEWELRARHDEESLASGMPWDGVLVGLDVEEDEHGDTSAGPKVESPLPIFDTPEGHRERARAFRAEARYRLAAVRRAVVEEVRTALQLLQSAQASLTRVESELLPIRERQCAEIEAAYAAGQADVTALILAEQAIGRAQESRLRLVSEVSTALHAVQRAVGGPVRFQTLSDGDGVAASSPNH